jgi:hypothetical protein
MAEKETISKLIIEMGGKEYELDGGGGGSQPGPNTVGSVELKDDGVMMEDLNTEVKEKMTHIYDSENEGIVLGGLGKKTE